VYQRRPSGIFVEALACRVDHLIMKNNYLPV